MVEQLKWLTLALIGLFSSPLVPRAASCRWLTNRIKASATSNDQQRNQNTDDERRKRMPIVRTRVFLS